MALNYQPSRSCHIFDNEYGAITTQTYTKISASLLIKRSYRTQRWSEGSNQLSSHIKANDRMDRVRRFDSDNLNFLFKKMLTQNTSDKKISHTNRGIPQGSNYPVHPPSAAMTVSIFGLKRPRTLFEGALCTYVNAASIRVTLECLAC